MSIHVVRDKKILGARIKECRKAKGWSAASVAALYGYSRNAILYWEKGTTLPLEGVLTFCYELDIPPCVIFEYDQEEFEDYIDLIDVRPYH